MSRTIVTKPRLCASCSLVLRQRLLLAGGQLMNVVKNAFDIAVFLQQRTGGLLADAAHAGHIVGGIAHQCLVVDDLLGRKPLESAAATSSGPTSANSPERGRGTSRCTVSSTS